MAWPPPVLPTNRTDTTAELDTHAADHNAASLAINDTVTRLKRAELYIYAFNTVALFDVNGLWYCGWATVPGAPVWSEVPATVALVTQTTIYNDAGVSLGTYQPHNNETSLVLQANYCLDGRPFTGNIGVQIIAEGVRTK